MAQTAEHLRSKYKVLNSKPSTAKNFKQIDLILLSYKRWAINVYMYVEKDSDIKENIIYTN
jgi:hypothetical protein